MKSWLDIEQRFRKLVDPLQYLRLDAQWGAAGEHWRLAGMQRNSRVKEFETLTSIAGNALAETLDQESELGRILLAEQNPRIRWYRALKATSGEFQQRLPSEQLNEHGDFAGHIFFGSIANVVEVSANFCLTMHVEHPLMNNETMGSNINISDSTIGILNTGEMEDIHSVSVNVSNLRESGHDEVAEALEQLTEAVAKSDEIAAETREAILEQLEELSRQAALEPEKRFKSGVIKALMVGISSGIGTAGALAEVWSTWGPTIRTFFDI